MLTQHRYSLCEYSLSREIGGSVPASQKWQLSPCITLSLAEPQFGPVLLTTRLPLLLSVHDLGPLPGALAVPFHRRELAFLPLSAAPSPPNGPGKAQPEQVRLFSEPAPVGPALWAPISSSRADTGRAVASVPSGSSP